MYRTKRESTIDKSCTGFDCNKQNKQGEDDSNVRRDSGINKNDHEGGLEIKLPPSCQQALPAAEKRRNATAFIELVECGTRANLQSNDFFLQKRYVELRTVRCRMFGALHVVMSHQKAVLAAGKCRRATGVTAWEMQVARPNLQKKQS